jgi:hypothetical protein
MGALYGVDVGDDLGVRTTATSYDDYSGDPPEGVPGIAEVVAPVGDFLDLIPDVGLALTAGDGALLVDPSITRDNRTVDARYAEFDVDEFIAIEGKPRAVTDLVNVIAPQMLVTGLGELETYPEPEATVVDSQARWLPQTPRYPANLQWFPFSVNGAEDRLVNGGKDFAQLKALTWTEVALQPWLTFSGLSTVVTGAQGDLTWYSSSGATPTIASGYTYVRGGGFVSQPAMVMRGGQYLFSDTLAWESDQVTIAMVVVIRTPRGEWCPVVESVPTLDATQAPISLRYHRSGVLALWSGSVLGEIQLQAGITRPNQPVIVALNINFAETTATVACVDTATHVISSTLPSRPTLRPRLVMGYSRLGGAPASMEVLEVDYWTTNFTQADLLERLAQLDRIYGVSSS